MTTKPRGRVILPPCIEIRIPTRLHEVLQELIRQIFDTTSEDNEELILAISNARLKLSSNPNDSLGSIRGELVQQRLDALAVRGDCALNPQEKNGFVAAQYSGAMLSLLQLVCEVLLEEKQTPPDVGSWIQGAHSSPVYEVIVKNYQGAPPIYTKWTHLKDDTVDLYNKYLQQPLISTNLLWVP